MDERELLARCDTEWRLSEGTSEVSNDRVRAMEYYLARPYGKLAGREGYSSVITRTTMDVIEMMLPSIIEGLTTEDRMVEFAPRSADDEEAAAQETDYVNHVFWRDNPGFLIVYSAIKDALLLKDAYIKTYWDDSYVLKQARYARLSGMEMAMLLEEPTVQPIAHREYPDPDGAMEPVEVVDPVTGMPAVAMQPVMVHDLVVNHVSGVGRERVEVLPPEQVRVSEDSQSIICNEARFVGHTTYVTRSELLAQGIPADVVERLPHFAGRTVRETREKRARYADVRSRFDVTIDQGEGATEVIEIRHAYLQIDWDGDGYAERRHIQYCAGAGAGGVERTVLTNEYVPFVPIYHLSPVLMTHRHTGISVAGMVEDLHEITTVLWRQLLDNLYRTNNPERAVNEDRVADLDEWEMSAPGNIKRVEGDPAAAYADLTVPFVAGASFPMLDLVEKAQHERTGTHAHAMGVKADDLQNVNTGVANQALSMARQRLHLIVRLMAETGFRELFRGIHADLQMNQDKERVISLRGKWVPINPSNWETRDDLVVNVGLSSGSTAEKVAELMSVRRAQIELWHGGGAGELVTKQNIYNTHARLVAAVGLRNPELYFQDPDSEEAQAAQQAKEQARQAEQQRLEEAVRAQLAIELRKIGVDENKLIANVQADRDKSDREWTKLEIESEVDVGGRGVTQPGAPLRVIE